jgi:hypothetical protein
MKVTLKKRLEAMALFPRYVVPAVSAKMVETALAE